MGRLWICLGLVIFAFALSPVSRASTIHVPSEQPTIQAGVDAASAGDTVLVAMGTYTGSANRDITFDGVDLVLRSEKGPVQTIIDCQCLGAGFSFRHEETEEAVVEGFTIRQGGGWDGGGMNMELSSPTIKRCVFVDCFAEGAGAAFVVYGGAPRFVACEFVHGIANKGGGGACWGSSPTFLECAFVDNLATEGAAFFGEGGTATFDRCTFASNSSWDGEVIRMEGGDLELVGCTVSHSACTAMFLYDCTASISQTIIAFGDMSPVVVCGGSTTVQLSCCDIYGNTGGDWVGCIADQYGLNGNISEDPLFCGASWGDFTLDAASPCAPDNSGGCGLIGAWPVGCGTTGVGPAAVSPARPRLTIRPNPIVSSAEFVLGEEQSATLEIYDPVGRLVERLGVSGSATWTPGRSLRSGVYFARLQGAGESQVVRFVVLR